MEKQLKRKFDNEMYYCQKIVSSKYEAQQYAKKIRYRAKDKYDYSTKARIVKIKDKGQSKYCVYVRTAK